MVSRKLWSICRHPWPHISRYGIITLKTYPLSIYERLEHQSSGRPCDRSPEKIINIKESDLLNKYDVVSIIMINLTKNVLGPVKILTFFTFHDSKMLWLGEKYDSDEKKVAAH